MCIALRHGAGSRSYVLASAMRANGQAEDGYFSCGRQTVHFLFLCRRVITLLIFLCLINNNVQ